MWAVITKDEKLVARDFATKPAALAWIKYQPYSGLQVIDQNTNRFIQIEMKSRRR